MKKLHTFSFLIALFIMFSINSFSQPKQKITGNWSGKLELPTGNLELIFKISENESGNLVTKLDVPAQGAKDLAVSETKISGDSLFLNVAMILGKYEGKFTPDFIIEGNWKQGDLILPLTLKKTNSITELKRPQTPKEPYPYLEKEVEYINPKSGLKLAGTLTLPRIEKNCPAVILISGSGAQDRDETIFEHKPFMVIADYLTRNGIAVLRVDDRGIGGSEGNTSNATSEDFAGDVEAGVNFLKSINEVNPKQIGLIGHSEGGIVAPIVAAKSNDISFIILLAGPGIPGDEILIAQTELINRAAGMSESVINQNLQVTKKLVEILKTKNDAPEAKKKLQEAFSGGMYQMANDDQKKLIDAKIDEINNQWFRFFLSYDPIPTIAKVDCPVLALNGSKDLQVPADENLFAIEKALKEGGNTIFKTMKIDGLNHLFQHCKTGAPEEYAQIEETFSPEVLSIINNWIWDFALKN
ncbi:MAG: alpha/beta fold hydrolase [Prolixibacteraceae bacterium]|nr:alpha/beta fold hydrolase [Prolixibacteraceae bacterium]